MGMCVAWLEVVAVVGRNQREAEVTGQREKLSVREFLLGHMIILHLDIISILVENLGEFLGYLACPPGVAALDRLIDLAAEAARKAEDAFVEFIE